MTTPSNAHSSEFMHRNATAVGVHTNSTFESSIPSAQSYPATATFNHSMLYQQTFLKGKPKLLGIVLIVAASLQIVLGIASIFTTVAISLTSGINFWGPALYISAGAVTIQAQARFKICMIKSSFGLNVASIFISFLALVMVCVDLAVISHGNYPHYKKGSIAGGYFVLITLLLSDLLMFSVAIYLSLFGFHSMTLAPQKFLIKNEISVAMPEPLSHENPEGSINGSFA
ncbi:membrane-spanning 4-domains subfamily A member 4A-like [Pyxicephalus adspersus]|uniref:membrane-spanning 4-domains subfamily A member 4A-like n=1 Tax=Pyxicephalus adspersus TaxID=30357 RepID=UPI003B5CC39F